MEPAQPIFFLEAIQGRATAQGLIRIVIPSHLRGGGFRLFAPTAREEAKSARKAKQNQSLEVVVAVAQVCWVAYYTDWVRGRPTQGRAYTKVEPATEVRFHPRKVMATILRPDGTAFRKARGGFTMEGPNGEPILPPDFKRQSE